LGQAEHQAAGKDEFDGEGSLDADGEQACRWGLVGTGAGGAEASAPGVEGGKGQALGGAEGGPGQAGLLEAQEALLPEVAQSGVGTAAGPDGDGRGHGGAPG